MSLCERCGRPSQDPICSICESSKTGVHRHVSFSAKAAGTTKPKSAGDLRSLRFWLASNALPPVPLGLAPELLIGRESSCDIVLPEKAVSRKHGWIRSNDEHVLFVDGGSVNGTKINGKRVKTEKVLEKGDQLEIGPYFLDVLGLDDTIPFAKCATNGTASGAVRGRMQDMRLTDFLVGIEKTGRTGVLKVVDADETRGKLVICDGLVLEAKIGKKRKREAALHMLSLQEGRYAFAIDENQRPFEGEPEGLALSELIAAARRS